MDSHWTPKYLNKACNDISWLRGEAPSHGLGNTSLFIAPIMTKASYVSIQITPQRKVIIDS